MKFVSNAGQQRVIDLLRPALAEGPQLDVLSPSYSLFAYAELMADAAQVTQARLIVSPPPPPARVVAGTSVNSPASDNDLLPLLGSPSDRAARNRLQTRWLASHFAQWVQSRAEVRQSRGAIPQAALVVRDA